MPFGLANAPATFQSYIHQALRLYLDVFVVVYLDDVLVYSDSLESHWQHVRTVLECLEKHKLYVKLPKCEFAREEVDFLGFVIGRSGVKMQMDRVTTIKDWPTPCSFHDIRHNRFLLCKHLIYNIVSSQSQNQRWPVFIMMSDRSGIIFFKKDNARIHSNMFMLSAVGSFHLHSLHPNNKEKEGGREIFVKMSHS